MSKKCGTGTKSSRNATTNCGSKHFSTCMLQSHVVSQVKKSMLCTFVKEAFWYRSCLPSSASTHWVFLVLYTQIFCLREWGSFEIDQYLKGQPPHPPSTYGCFRSVDWFWNCSRWSVEYCSNTTERLWLFYFYLPLWKRFLISVFTRHQGSMDPIMQNYLRLFKPDIGTGSQ